MTITTAAVLALASTNPTLHNSIKGLDSWNGIQSISLPGSQSKSIRLAKPVVLNLSVGGFKRTEALDGMDGEFRLQQHDGRFHGALKSLRHGDWIRRDTEPPRRHG
ncbi:MAG: hypothetical protein GY894_01930 [Planctomycetes bacterium]|jgi:hypothetical protein|nr:hypothetical protein [Planctomycetota bacterium]MCP4838109.1 hypothetical protein [Planctomycetota bacterium]